MLSRMVSKYIFSAIIIVRLIIPMGMKETWTNVTNFRRFAEGVWLVGLDDGRTLYLPMAFTVIEER